MSESSKVKAWAAKNNVSIAVGKENGAVELRAPATKSFTVSGEHTLTMASGSAGETWKNLLKAIRNGLEECPIVCECRNLTSSVAPVVPPALPDETAVPRLNVERAVVVAPIGAPAEWNREQWLTALAEKLRPAIESAGGFLPTAMKLACGWPSKGALSAKQRRIGECWAPAASAEGVTEMFISPALHEPLSVAETVLHELVHASGAFKHTGQFRKLALAVGFQEPMKSTPASPALKEKLAEILATLPAYPHSKLEAMKGNQKKEGTRLLKVSCDACGYTVRVTQKWIAVGYPTCPCGDVMGGEQSDKGEEGEPN